MEGFNGKLVIVTSSPGVRDVIYIGYVRREGDFLCLTQSSMILWYADVGVSGISGNPKKATRLRPVTSSDGQVWIPISSISAMVEADEKSWKLWLGVSRDD